jgi:hypothetical protein
MKIGPELQRRAEMPPENALERHLNIPPLVYMPAWPGWL